MSAIVEVTSDEQAKQIFQCLKKYYENQNPNAKYYANLVKYDDKYKKNSVKNSNERYKNDEEYRKKKIETAKRNNEKKKKLKNSI